MEVLELHGKRYISAGKAAKDNGYTSDYVGQLCRSGAIDATRVGRSWYVSADAIKSHRSEKKRATTKVARSSLVKSVSVTRRQNSVGIDSDSYERRYAHVAGSVVISPDVSPLIPRLQKSTLRPLAVAVRKDISIPPPPLFEHPDSYVSTQEEDSAASSEDFKHSNDDQYVEPTVSVPITIADTHSDIIHSDVTDGYRSEIVEPEEEEVMEHISERPVYVHAPQIPQNIPQSFSPRKTTNYTQAFIVVVCVLSVAFLSTVLFSERGEVHAGGAVRTSYAADMTLLQDIRIGLRSQ